MKNYYGRPVEINRFGKNPDAAPAEQGGEYFPELIPTGKMGYLLELNGRTDLAYVEMPDGTIRQYNFRLLRFVYPRDRGEKGQ